MLSLFIVSKTCCYFLFEINILFLQIDVNFAICDLRQKMVEMKKDRNRSGFQLADLLFDHGYKHIYCHDILAALGYNDIGKFLGRLDELIVH